MSQRSGNIIFCTIGILVSLYFIYEATTFDTGPSFGSSELSSGFFPISILSIIILCSLINILQSIRDTELSEIKIKLDRIGLIRAAVGFMICIISYFIWKWLGFIIMSTFFMITLSVVLKVRSPAIYVSLVLLGPALYFIFAQALKVFL